MAAIKARIGAVPVPVLCAMLSRCAPLFHFDVDDIEAAYDHVVGLGADIVIEIQFATGSASAIHRQSAGTCDSGFSPRTTLSMGGRGRRFLSRSCSMNNIRLSLAIARRAEASI